MDFNSYNYAWKQRGVVGIVVYLSILQHPSMCITCHVEKETIGSVNSAALTQLKTVFILILDLNMRLLNIAATSHVLFFCVNTSIICKIVVDKALKHSSLILNPAARLHPC